MSQAPDAADWLATGSVGKEVCAFVCVCVHLGEGGGGLYAVRGGGGRADGNWRDGVTLPGAYRLFSVALVLSSLSSSGSSSSSFLLTGWKTPALARPPCTIEPHLPTVATATPPPCSWIPLWSSSLQKYKKSSRPGKENFKHRPIFPPLPSVTLNKQWEIGLLPNLRCLTGWWDDTAEVRKHPTDLVFLPFWEF